MNIQKLIIDTLTTSQATKTKQCLTPTPSLKINLEPVQ
jgi:hypothetical protein